MKRKKYKFNSEDLKSETINKINDNNNKIWCPTTNIKTKPININTCFDISESNINKNTFNETIITDILEKVEYKAIKIILKLNKNQ